MHDKEIRALLKATVLAPSALAPGTRLVEEMCLCLARVDIACINDDALTGYEIKSDVDTLKRLAWQIPCYDQVFDFCTLVTTPRHVVRAEAMLPDHWGCYLAREGAVVPLWEPQANPRTELYPTLNLLWCDEIRAVLRSRGEGRGCRNKYDLVKRLTTTADTATIRGYVRARLRVRQNWLLPKSEGEPPAE